MLRRLTGVLLVFVLLGCMLPASAASGTLRKGSRGAEVKKLQTALQEMGYYTLKVDGIYGKGTVRAVQAFQRKNGLKADGIAGPKTMAKLYGNGDNSGASSETAPAAGQQGSYPKLREGDSGEAVSDLQTRLQALGFYSGGITGSFDEETRKAVILFQKSKKLTQDGIAGPKTFAALDAAWSEAQKTIRELPEAAEALLNQIRTESGAVCGTLVLTRDGETLLSWSFGGVDENTCFRIASVTKWVTAIGLMTLYDQGRLDLDRDISDYLPFTVRNPAWPDTPITARMLLSHTSSLSPDASVYRPKWESIGQGGYDPVFDESVQPGTKYMYADYNGALFGCLIEAITGESVQDYMDRTVFSPLGLTAAYSPKYLPAGTATRDLLKADGTVGLSVANDLKYNYNNKADPRANNGYTVGGLYISTASLTVLARMMLAGGELNGVRILNRTTVSLMESDQPGLAESKYGLSTVRHSQFPRGAWYGHQGRYLGLTSNVYYQTDTGITLALVMDGYDYQLEDNIVLPAVTLMKNMEMLENAVLNPVN